MVFADQVADTPDGSPVEVPIPVAPVVACVIFGNTELIHKVGVEDAGPVLGVGKVRKVIFRILLFVESPTYKLPEPSTATPIEP